MNQRRVSKSEKSFQDFEPIPMGSPLRDFMRLARRTILTERDRQASRLLDNDTPSLLLPRRRPRQVAVFTKLMIGRFAWHLTACVFCLAAALAAMGAGVGLNEAIAAQRGRADREDGVQVLTRGPVHEAFAETVTFDPKPGIVVSNAPPDAIEELPPEQRPAGANVEWIPGYWAWDDERSDFLWASGIWRALPPGRQWVAGYWGKTGQGAQWTSGYWADADVNEVEYLPEPPQSVETGPSTEAISPDSSWAPGSWVWHQNRYAWRPGYWAEVQPDWVWVPAHYVWTRRGYVFVDGYYDYAVNRRGVLFAPVYFDSSVYSRRGFSYSPSIVIDLVQFTDHLFLRPNYGHYYFGDYYAASYNTLGFYPWFSFHSGGYGYDPFYAHYRWRHRQDREWEQRIAAHYGHRRDHEEARPARTLAAMNLIATRGGNPTEKIRVLATSLDQLAKSKDSPIRFQPVDKQERQKLAQRTQDVQSFREQRQKLETNAAAPLGEKSARGTKPVKATRPTSPILSKAADARGKVGAAPKTHVTPKPDPKVQPQPRTAAERPSREAAPKTTKVVPQPKPAVARPSRQETPKTTKAQSTPEAPKAESKPKPSDDSKDKPKGESKGKSKK